MTKEEKIQVAAHVFIQWLASENMLEEWIKYTIQHKRGIESVGIDSMYKIREPVNYAIIWSKTEQGKAFWRELNNKWIRDSAKLIRWVKDE